MRNILASLMVMLLSVICQAQPIQTNIYADNIMIVFDASGSMGYAMSHTDKRPRLPIAQKALKQVLQKIPDNSNIGLFVFGDIRNDNPVQIGPKDLNTLNSAIDAIRTGGGTPLGSYMQRASNQLLEQRQKNLGYGRYKLLVVTDGEATDGDLMQRVAREVIKRNLSLEVIGVAMSGNHTLSSTCTVYRAANDEESLNRAMAAVAETKAVPASDTNESDFDIIQGLSDEQIRGIIGSLGNTENQPLFEAPKIVAADSAPPSSVDSSSVQSSSTALNEPIIIFIVLGVILLLVLAATLISAAIR